MTFLEEIQSVAAKVAPFAALMQTLESATGLGGAPAALAVQVIKIGVDALAQQGKIGTATADQFEAQLRAMLAGTAAGEAADDAEADAIVASRRMPPASP